MAHAIMEGVDAGFVWGDTWHRMTELVRLNRPVTVEEALKVFDYPIDICQSGIFWKDLTYSKCDSYKIGRPDKRIVFNEAVSSGYTLFDMDNCIKFAVSQIIEAHSYDGHPIEIETAMTLKGGAIQLVSLVVDRTHIHGDDSPTLTRIMITNDMTGKNGVAIVFSTVRVVCDNTRGWAIAQAKAGGDQSYCATRHNSTVNEVVLTALKDMTEIKLASRNEKLRLDALAKYGDMSASVRKGILDSLYPVSYDENGDFTKRSRRKDAHNHINELMAYGQDGIHPAYSKTPYAFFNAITNYEARKNGRKSSKNESDADQARRVAYDNIAGSTAAFKERALNIIELHTVNA